MSSVLPTKTEIPLPPVHPVSRPRLLNALENNILHYKLALVSATAGYGKTTFLAQWARASQFPVAWCSLDEVDSDFEQFFRCLLFAWETVHPEIMQSQFGTLFTATSIDHESVLTAFINSAQETSKHTIFVLDDFHLIDDKSIQKALAFLLDHLPAIVHFVLSSRSEPPQKPPQA